jgi:hypothetical protein
LELVGPLKQQQQDTAATDNAVDSDIPYYEPGNGFQYLQIAVDNYRISKVIASGGNVLTGYGKCMLHSICKSTALYSHCQSKHWYHYSSTTSHSRLC